MTLGCGCVGKAPMDSRRVEVSPGVYSVADANNAKRVVDVIGLREVRCRRRRPLGTNITHTSCQTEKESAEVAEHDQEQMWEQMRRRAFTNPSAGATLISEPTITPGRGGG